MLAELGDQINQVWWVSKPNTSILDELVRPICGTSFHQNIRSYRRPGCQESLPGFLKVDNRAAVVCQF